MLFVAETFLRVLAKAKDHNIRAISLARRDYRGSTPFSETELDQLRGSNAIVHRAFLRERGLEVARFLITMIDTLNLPPLDDEGRGGLSLMAWSFGNITMFAFAHFFSTYPQTVQDHLKTYLKSFVAYGARSYFSFD